MSLTSALGSLSATASTVGSLASTLSGGSWQTSLRTASFGGVPFAIESVRTSGGRRVSIHSYPFRDSVWVEDVGMLPRTFRVTGFLIENSAIYGGGGVVTQANNLLKACETSGGMTFVHPTLGTISNVSSIAPVELNERKDLGRVFEVGLTLMVGGARVYPTSTASTADVIDAASDTTIASSLVDFASSVASALTLGVSIVNEAVSTVTKWKSIAESVVSDVKAAIGAVSSLSGSYGRYAAGSNSGYASSNASASSTATVSSLLAAAVTNRTAVTTASTAMLTAAADVSDTSSFSASITAVVEAVAATATDPADAVRILSTLADFTPDDATTSSVIGDGMATMQTAVGALVRRAVLAQLGVAASTYQPSSADDAATVRDAVVELLDDEITIAGDAGDDSSYSALRALRTAVIDDLNSRGASLPSMTTFKFASALPSLVLANRMYADPSRSDEIITEADPIHPAFMPSSFSALAS
ncbi:DNA circularization N-terminal domain-containing protein [Paraburkholderia tropica]|uniref:DNA circularization protein n=1 Tax=Paraburkholderia tropica TaxID=92647 RepID=UPI0032B38739